VRTLTPIAGRARVLGGFAAFGICWGTWGAVLPAVQADAGVDDGQLGTALLFIGAGALVSMRIAGTILDRTGALTLPAALALLAGAAIVPGFADSMLGLCLALLLLGAASGAADVAINAEGVRYEAATERPVMGLAHATFSAAVIVGALLTGALREGGAEAPLALGATAAVIAVAAAILVRTPTAGDGELVARASLRGVPRPLLILGALCALAFFVENAWQSWGALYLEGDLDASPWIAALAPALFAASAATARLAGHGLASRVSGLALLRAGALLGAVGTLAASAAGSTPLALAGVILAGAGISICAPILLSLAGRDAPEAVRGAAVSIVTTIAYFGFLVGPAAVGLLAEATTLRASLASVAAVALLLAALAASAAPREPALRRQSASVYSVGVSRP
jgi:predicted MFS family arabinose efflux permease